MGADFLNRINVRKPSEISEEQLNRIKTIAQIEKDRKEQEKRDKLKRQVDREH